jgi:hypothetical protein
MLESDADNPYRSPEHVQLPEQLEATKAVGGRFSFLWFLLGSGVGLTGVMALMEGVKGMGAILMDVTLESIGGICAVTVASLLITDLWKLFRRWIFSSYHPTRSARFMAGGLHVSGIVAALASLTLLPDWHDLIGLPVVTARIIALIVVVFAWSVMTVELEALFSKPTRTSRSH